MNDKPSYPPIRRVVTGHDAGNVAKVIMDAPATNAKYPSAGLVSTLIWTTDRAPADIAVGDAIEDMGARILGTAPPVRARASQSSTFRPATRRICIAPRRSIMSS